MDTKYKISDFTGSRYCYPYRELAHQAAPEQIRDYCNAIRNRFLPIAKVFTGVDNSRWVLRHFLALKFSISAAILSGSAIYARDHNLLMGAPYFNYYALLNCCRAFLMTAPDIEWRGRPTLEMTHSKILNVTGDLMRRLDGAPQRQWSEKLRLAREHRELYSYQFPGTGLRFVGHGACDPDDTADFARLIVELAMLNSECFEACLFKHAEEKVSTPTLADHALGQVYEIAGIHIRDAYDSERLGKLVARWGRVSTLEVMASDGMIEDFYGSYASPDGDAGDFYADDYMSHLLVL